MKAQFKRLLAVVDGQTKAAVLMGDLLRMAGDLLLLAVVVIPQDAIRAVAGGTDFLPIARDLDVEQKHIE